MNSKTFERNDIIRKCDERKINIKKDVKKSISIKEYLREYCKDMIIDLKIISNYYNIDSKKIFKQLLFYSYELKIKNPRLRINYKKDELELYDLKKFQAVTIKSIKFRWNKKCNYDYVSYFFLIKGVLKCKG